ncbi:CHASE2 domain-containing protein [Lichenifustis flavocetrariae]|uniref:Adenylate/guanylate cyclase domain-containing protein n=1 Tax=Lichenifustis flavocetrariae TaxID=2949735 RepID=A0AA41YV08_9HYPH|nr:adenylate/guanylate cyclase domain-containing protein [Lichenifustis flavocetrariae]MCW6507582.1 adenylate/guanylate cyclase domain-containing protein [Lichenifustis flavocetrariae]
MRVSRAYLVIFFLLYVVTLALFVVQPPWLLDLRNFVFDRYQALDTPAYDPATPVRIVAIDEASLAKYGQWPWPRTRLAELVDRLADRGAATAAFDIIFAEPDRLSLEQVVGGLPDGTIKSDFEQHLSGAETNDALLSRAVARLPTALGMTMTQGASRPDWAAKFGLVYAGDPPAAFLPVFASALLPLAQLREAAQGLGATNWLPDHDQIVRRVPLLLRCGDAIVPSLAMEALRLAQGASTYVVRSSNASGTTAFGQHTGLNAIKVGDFEIATGSDGSIRPRYTHTNAARYISAAEVLDGTMPEDAVRGRIVLIGTPVTGLGDVKATPLDAVVPGVEIHAQVLEQLLAGKLLSRPDWGPGLELFATLVFLTLLATTLPRLPPSLAALLSLLAAVFILVGSWVGFTHYNLLLDPAFPCLVIGTAYLSGASSLWESELQSERQVRRAFGKFVSPAVVSRIAENPRLLVLSGETRELTILFSDLRSFSTISESLSASEVAHFLNTYLTPMTDVILAHEGTIDKYIGDAIVAFWNAPLDVADHSRRAVEAALAMRAALVAFNEEQDRLAALGQKTVRNVRMGLGLNRGACSVGNMGSQQRFDYSALGDPMNVAARLEALTKSYQVDILATASVLKEVPDFAWLEVDEVRVKGRSGVTQLFTIVGDEAYAASPAFKALAGAHEELLAATRDGEFRTAARLAQNLAGSVEPRWRPFYQALELRCRDLARQLPQPETA